MKQLAGVLLFSLLLVGCGQDYPQTATTSNTTGGGTGGGNTSTSPTPTTTPSPTGSPGSDVVVTITGTATGAATFANVTQFRITLLQSNTTSVVNRQVLPRTAQNSLVATFSQLTSGTAYVVANEALGAAGQPISFNIQGVTAPNVVSVSNVNFTPGPLPAAPFPVPSPSTGASPSASPGVSPSPGGSPAISPTPGPAPSASVGLPPTPSPSPR